MRGSSAAPAPVRPAPRPHRQRLRPRPSWLEPPPAPCPLRPWPWHDAVAPLTNPPASGSLEQLWRDLVEAVGRVSPFTRSYFLEAFPVSLTGKVLTIGFDPSSKTTSGWSITPRTTRSLPQAGRTGPSWHAGEVRCDRGACSGRCARNSSVHARALRAHSRQACGSAGRLGPQPKAASKTFDVNDFKNDPLIQKALEIFKGRIVDVARLKTSQPSSLNSSTPYVQHRQTHETGCAHAAGKW